MRVEKTQNICQEQDAAVAAAELAQIKADQDYISMMTGVDFEEETEEMSHGKEV